MKIKVVSFDLDNCLINKRFDDVIWFEKIPRVYAEKNHIPFKEAHRIVSSEYARLKGKTERWRDIEFWLPYFGIRKEWEEVCSGLEKEVKLYPDVIPALLSLRKKYKIVVISHAERNFLNLKLKASGLSKFIDYSFSSRKELKSYHKKKDAFLYACRKIGIKPSEMVHIGDNEEYDYLEPMKAGIRSFVIERSGKSGKHRIKNLEELERILAKG